MGNRNSNQLIIDTHKEAHVAKQLLVTFRSDLVGTTVAHRGRLHHAHLPLAHLVLCGAHRSCRLCETLIVVGG